MLLLPLWIWPDTPLSKRPMAVGLIVVPLPRNAGPWPTNTMTFVRVTGEPVPALTDPSTSIELPRLMEPEPETEIYGDPLVAVHDDEPDDGFSHWVESNTTGIETPPTTTVSSMADGVELNATDAVAPALKPPPPTEIAPEKVPAIPVGRMMNAPSPPVSCSPVPLPVGVSDTLTLLKPIRVTGVAVPGYSAEPVLAPTSKSSPLPPEKLASATLVAAEALPTATPGLKIAVAEPAPPRFSNSCGAAPVSPNTTSV